MIKTASVTQNGKFFKVITNTGEDISNQIERPMRKKALELGKQLEWDDVKKTWKISGDMSVQIERPVQPITPLETLEELLLAEAPKKRKRKIYTTVEMPMPSYKIGSVVDVEFIGKKYKVKLTDLKKNPTNTMRWIYDGECIVTSLKIPFIGIGDTEEFANIIVEK